MIVKKYLNYIIPFFICFILFYILFNCCIADVIYPFAFSFLFSLMYTKKNIVPIVISYTVAGLLVLFDTSNIICILCTVICWIVPYFVHYFLHKPIKKIEIYIYACLSQIPSVLFAVFGDGAFYFNILSIIVGCLMIFVFMKLIDIYEKKFINKLTLIEKVSGCLFLGLISNGLSNINFINFSFVKVFVAIMILFFAYCGHGYSSILIGTVLGFGVLLSSNNSVLFAPFVIWSMFVILFKNNKYYMVTSLILSECLIGWYFNMYYSFGIIELLPVVISSVLFILIPNKKLDYLRERLFISNTRMAVKDVVNRNREVLERKLMSLSDAFNDIGGIFKKITKESVDDKEIIEIFKRDLKRKVCESCAERQICHKAYSNETDKVLDELSKRAFEKGKLSILDIPSYMNSHCNKISAMISEMNVLCNQYKNYCKMADGIDNSKLLISEQMIGVSQIMKKMANDVKSKISFNNLQEEKILNELICNGIDCDDVIVINKDIYSVEVELLVRNENKNDEILSKSVGKVLKQEVGIQRISSHVKPGWSMVLLGNIPKLDCTFGVSTCVKNGSNKSGDCYCVQKLDKDKFMFAICDGMGSGEKSAEVSEMTINLIEDFYKAGFDNDNILSSINKLLSLQKEENFTALDICILDLKEENLSLIKMGSPSSFLFNKEKCEILDGKSLPMGIVKESVPNMKKITVQSGDYIVLTSDGINDSFKSDEDLAELICLKEENNPQKISDLILEKALNNNKEIAKDDMTILVIKIF